MKKIGLLSDTHGYFDDKLKHFFKDVDEIWHAGDIGSLVLADIINDFKPLKAVYGNIDGSDVRIVYPKFLRFSCEDLDVLITHIGGHPGKYDTELKEILKRNPPALLICGHSHILRVKYDKQFNFLFVNPGGAGKIGIHNVRTAVRFIVEGNTIKDMEVGEWAK